MDAQKIVDRFLDNLEKTVYEDKNVSDESGSGDAIVDVLGSSPRGTGVSSLRQHPDLIKFRKELSAGMVRSETIIGVIEILDKVLSSFGIGR